MHANARADKTVIILEELKFDWKESVLEVVIELWNGGMTLMQLARHLRVTTDEAFLVLFHLAREGQIESRPGGLLGA